MRKYSKDYKVVLTEDKKGHEKRKAVYRGKYFEINVDERRLKTLKIQCLILSALVIIFHIAGGFIASQGMYQFYISLPYAFAFLPLYLLAAGVFRLPTKKRKFRRDEIDLSFKRTDTWALVLLISLGVCVVGEVVFMIWFMEGNVSQELSYLGLEVVSVLFIFIMIRLLKPVLGRIVSDQEDQKQRD